MEASRIDNLKTSAITCLSRVPLIDTIPGLLFWLFLYIKGYLINTRVSRGRHGKNRRIGEFEVLNDHF
jgi:hypothetical protein